ncbi:hypothetical protein [Caulobacter phage DCM]|uniref:Uncharacterized protein n=1 Tax=Caulobacter phage DCM TaxID=3020391 RepID=A0AAF0B404_9CAUD|nr:hypothetical protein [Caulobacter phage DCM]WCD56109.1 hypothetical protein [Caulobacter phage BL199]
MISRDIASDYLNGCVQGTDPQEALQEALNAHLKLWTDEEKADIYAYIVENEGAAPIADVIHKALNR